MDLHGLLEFEIEDTFQITEKLLDLVKDDTLEWKPAAGSNWMTVAQLLHHLSDACGAPIRGFVTGDWGMPQPEEGAAEPQSVADMIPPAEKLPSICCVAEAKRLLLEDRKLALEMLAQCSEERLATEPASAPWDPGEMVLGQRILQMVDHLKSHKAQLFYYFKLQGMPVHTGHLWGGG